MTIASYVPFWSREIVRRSQYGRLDMSVDMEMRCAACGHEGKEAVRDGISSCARCGSKDVFKCGTPSSGEAWARALELDRDAARKSGRGGCTG